MAVSPDVEVCTSLSLCAEGKVPWVIWRMTWAGLVEEAIGSVPVQARSAVERSRSKVLCWGLGLRLNKSLSGSLISFLDNNR